MGGFKEYWNTWLWRDATTRIITINTLVWIVIGSAMLFIPRSAHQWWIGLFAMPGTLLQLPARIWTVGTYMVSQYDFLHLLVNMLWVLLFGRMLSHMVGDKHVVGCYVVSGLAGAAGFMISNMLFGSPGQVIIGASCAVIGICGACGVLMPRWQVNLLLFGSVRVIWIVVAAVVLFVIMQPTLCISIAHGAGLAGGILYALWLRRSDDFALDQHYAQQQRFTRPRGVPRNMGGSRQPQPSSADVEAELDALLEKVSRSGYDSLSYGERQRLFELSQRLKK